MIFAAAGVRVETQLPGFALAEVANTYNMTACAEAACAVVSKVTLSGPDSGGRGGGIRIDHTPPP